MPNTSRLGLPYPALSDIPSGPLAVFNLANAVDGLGVIGGKRRTSTSANVSTVESIVIDTQNLALAASSAFTIDFHSNFSVTVIGTDVYMRIRMTNVSGTVLGEAILPTPYYTTPPLTPFIRAVYKTTAAELVYFCGTMIRQSGTGVINALVPTSLIVTRLGPSSLIGDF